MGTVRWGMMRCIYWHLVAKLDKSTVSGETDVIAALNVPTITGCPILLPTFDFRKSSAAPIEQVGVKSANKFQTSRNVRTKPLQSPAAIFEMITAVMDFALQNPDKEVMCTFLVILSKIQSNFLYTGRRRRNSGAEDTLISFLSR